MVLLTSIMSLMIFCLLNLSVTHGEVSKSPTVRVGSSAVPCGSRRFCLGFILSYFDTLLLGAQIKGYVFLES